jgi:hypothetical protein
MKTSMSFKPSRTAAVCGAAVTLLLSPSVPLAYATPGTGIGPCQSQAAQNPGVSIPGEFAECPLPRP